ncbi:glycosyltransferase family 4 protein [Bacillus sp. FJAT-27445]|uniref:glycosyltransferase family 4 protein n=1 Tax=Bacillus sp. FJAT-27445 TaxID=1679166 RepID=UPI000AA33B32|nr:glycosyltransferase family 4 protein [Bacillus sp. FJAT-27445]
METHITTIINDLSELGHHILLYTASTSPSVLSQINSGRFKVLSWADGSIDAIKSFDPHIIHAHPFTAIVTGKELAIQLNKPLIVTMHGIYDLGFDDSPLGHDVSPHVKRIIAVDLRVALFLLNRVIEPEKISIIRNGIDFEKFHPIKKNRQKAASLGLNPDSPTISIISRFDDDKEVPIIQFLRCLPELAKCVGSLNVLIIGDGGKLKEVKAAIPRKLPNGVRVKLLGWQENVSEFYALSDLVFGSGRVALEALACKVPVYAMWDGFGELITKYNHDAVMSGIAFKQISDSQLIYNLSEILKKKDLLYQSAQEGYELVKSNYNSKKIAKQLIRIYEQYSH